MLLAENLKTPLSASIAFDRSSAYGLSPNPYTNRKSKHARRKNLMCLLFFCWFKVRVMRLAMLAVMSLHASVMI